MLVAGDTHTKDKTEDGHCVRWRIIWDNHPDTLTQGACPQDTMMKVSKDGLNGVSGVQDAILEQFPPADRDIDQTSPLMKTFYG
jgi:hypothetical protein